MWDYFLGSLLRAIVIPPNEGDCNLKNNNNNNNNNIQYKIKEKSRTKRLRAFKQDYSFISILK